MRIALSRPSVVVGLVLALAGCSAVPATGSPGSSATPAPSTSGAIDHPTGRTDVLLRVEEGGGFVAPATIVTLAPQFTLYGDGTVIVRDPSTPAPPPIGSVQPLPALRTARLTEEQIQAILKYAVGPGGLGIARGHYDPGNVADAGTTTFTVSAGGVTRTVSAVALGMGDGSSPDGPILSALAALRDRLVNFADEIGGGMVWKPQRFRAILMEAGVGAPKPWPWKTITEADFKRPVDPGRATFPIRVMSAAEVDELGMKGIEGGFQGLAVVAPSGKLYSIAMRPLLPDDKD